MSSTTLKLNNGHEIPVVGLGTFKSEAGEVSRAVKDAIDAGYRHFDCAWIYGNEAEVGLGFQEKLKEGAVKREDIFIVSKLWCTFMNREKVIPSLKETLKALQLDYLDLYLIHWPTALKENVSYPSEITEDTYLDIDYVETWEGMEECARLGLTKSIGVSNFNSQQIDRLLKSAKIKPVCNQVECSPTLNPKKLIQFCKERDIVVVGYRPLGGGKTDIEPTIKDPKIIEIGKKYGKTSAQIILNYLVSLGISVIPKSSNKTRIIENINIFDFSLTPEEVAYMDSLNKNIRLCPAVTLKGHKYYPFDLEF